MLVAKLHMLDLHQSPVMTASGWAIGRGTIEPFAHPALQAECHSSATRTAFIVRERKSGPEPAGHGAAILSERALDTRLRELKQWPLDFACVLIARIGGTAEVRFFCGRWGTAPLYLLMRDRVLHAHWNVSALYAELPHAKLDPAFAAMYLAELDHPYSRRTIFPDIQMLTERATATCAPPFDRIAIKYPPAETHAVARKLKHGARVTAAFREILSASMRSRILKPDQVVATELSGGLDSTIVAIAASEIAEGPSRSYGMIMPGPDGAWQRRRRADTIKRFGILDRSFPALDHPPFGPSSRRVHADAVIPFGEFYDEAVGHLLDLAKADGADFIFTGMGGDELNTLQWGEVFETDESDEEEGNDSSAEGSVAYAMPAFTAMADEAYRDGVLDTAPESLLHKSSIESAGAVAALYLEKGVWPISPLCTPELVEFCRSLPFAWRNDRTIERKVLTSFGCSRLVPHPTHLETFLDVMHGAMSRDAATLLKKLFAESRLAEQGLVDGDVLRQLYRRFLRGDRQYEDQLLGAAMLELTLRSVERRIAAKR